MRSKHQIRRGRGFAIRQRVAREADRREEKVLSRITAETLAASSNRCMRALGQLAGPAPRFMAETLEDAPLLQAEYRTMTAETRLLLEDDLAGAESEA